MNAENTTPEDSEQNTPTTPVVPAAEPAVDTTDDVLIEDDTDTVLDPLADDRTETLPAQEVEARDEVPTRIQTVYVTAPVPPKPRGNRGFGAIMTVVATIVFALVYAGIIAIIFGVARPGAFLRSLSDFVVSPLFYVPVLVFLVVMLLWALLANRSGWGSWVFGSLLIAVVVYLAVIGILLLIGGVVAQTPSQAASSLGSLAVNPAVIIAALVAREVSIWFGAGISARGRAVRARNIEARETFDRETADQRAQFERASA